jgi:rhodanese-related sulfurtransferase
VLFRRKPSITPQQTAERLAAGELVLIDVREPAEVHEECVEGAANIPLAELRHRVGELERRPVAFLCRSGVRSAIATGAALKAGHDAVNVKGGVTAWSRAGLPLTRDESR